MKKISKTISKYNTYKYILSLIILTNTTHTITNKKNITKQYYTTAHNYYTQKIPQFKQNIKTKNLYLYKNFYVTYIKNNRIFAFDLIKNKKVLERNIIYKNFVLHKNKTTSKKLFYNKKNILIKEKIHENINTNTKYNNSNNINKKNTNILSFGSESFQNLKYLLPKIKIKYLKITKKIKNNQKTISIKLLNNDNKNYSSIYIKAKLYNKNKELIESIIAYPKKNNTILEKQNYITIKSKINSKNPVRIQIFIHCKDINKPQYLGPFFFLKNKMKIKIKAIPYIKNINKKNNNNFYQYKQ